MIKRRNHDFLGALVAAVIVILFAAAVILQFLSV